MATRNFVWLSLGGGAWSLASNWADTTDGNTPSLITPGAQDSVAVTGPSGAQIQTLSGGGAVAAASFSGNTLLSGNYAVGTLALGSSGGILQLGGGASLMTGSANLAAGSLLAGSGSTIAAAGTVTLGTAGFASATLNATGGARVAALSAILNNWADSIYVDPASIVEIGSAGGAAAGRLTIDAGAVLAGQGSANAYGSVENDGTLAASGGTLTAGALSGAGTLQIGAGATLALNGACGAGQAVSFAGANATLSLNQEAFAPAGTLTGFTAGDAIDIRGSQISSASFAATGAAGGVLTLFYAGQVAARLQLAGSYGGAVFLTAGDGAGGTLVTVANASGSGGGPSQGTSSPDSYAWIAGGSGAWNQSANWQDVTTEALPAGVAPGSMNLVAIDASQGSFSVIAGPANAASLSLTGEVGLSGTITLGTLSVGQSAGTSFTAATLDVLAGTTITAVGAGIADGAISVSGSAALLGVSGTLVLGGSAVLGVGLPIASLSATAGGAVQAASLVMGGGSGAILTVDPTGSVEIGSAGHAAAGAVTVDAAATLVGNGQLNPFGSIVDNGIVLASGGTLSVGQVSGSGSLAIAAGAALELMATTGAPILLSGSTASGGSTLAFTERAIPTGTLTGFVAGDVIDLGGSELTAAQFTPSGTGGTLLLLYNASVVARLALAGSFAGQRFLLGPDGSGGSQIILAAASGGGGPPGQTGTDQLGWTAPVSGNWNRAACWTDMTTGALATLPPGAQTPVQMTGPGGNSFQSVSGTGTCVSLSLTGNTVLAGSFVTPQLSVGQAGTEGSDSIAGTLNIGPTTTLSAMQASLASGALLCIGAGSLLTVAGTLTLGDGYGDSSTFLETAGPAAIHAGGLTLDGDAAVEVVGASSIEIGTAGGAAAGVLTVDAGALVSGSGTLNLAAAIIDNGGIQAQGGTLLLGTVSGTGTLGIGTEATLALSAADACGINFIGGGATLLLPGSARLPSATIAGFAPGDSIVTGSPVDSVAFQQGGLVGTLTLSLAGQAVGQLLLAGSFDGDAFSVQPDGSGAAIILSAPQANGPPPGTVTPDSFDWTGAGDGITWADPGNWTDVSQGSGQAAPAPGQNDAVSIAGGAGSVLAVVGPADAAALSVSGSVALAGLYTAGTLSVGSATGSGFLALGPGSALSAAASQVAGALAVGGGGLSVQGTLALGGAAGPGVLAVSGPSDVRLGAVRLGGAGSAIATDASGSIEIGGTGSGAPGAITIDPGGLLQGAGSANLTGQIVDNGTLTCAGGTLLLGSVSGTGMLLVGTASDLVLTGAVDHGLTADFAGAGTLTLASSQGSPAIADFGTGDAILLPAIGADTASYAITGPGTGVLSLSGGGQVLTQLTLLGDQSGRTFSVTGAAGGGSILTTQPDNTSALGGTTVTNPNFANGQITRGDMLADIAAAFPFVSQTDAGALIGNEGIYLDYSTNGLSPAQTVFGGANEPVGVNVEVVAPLDGQTGSGLDAGGGIALAQGYGAVFLQGNEALKLTDAPIDPNTGHGVALGHALLVGNFGNDSIAALGDGDTLYGASGANTVFYAKLQNANGGVTLPIDVFIHGGGNDTIATNTDNAAITTSGGASEVVLGPSQNTVVSDGSDTIACVGSGGNDTITAQATFGHAGDLVFGPSQGLLSFIGGNTPNTVVGTGGEIDMQGGAGNGSLVWAGSGVVQYEEGTGSAVIVGGSGVTHVLGNTAPVTVFGGTGSGVFSGGPGSVFVVGSGASTVAAGAGEAVFILGAAPVSVAGSAGADVYGGGSTGSNIFQASTGSETLWGGAGNDLFAAGSGNDVLVSGGGNDVFSFTNGTALGSDTVVGFVPGQSTIALHGFGSQVPQISVAFGASFINLANGAQIIVDNVTNLTAANFTFT